MCCWNSSPEREEKMSLQEIKNYVNQARAISSIEQISLTGGEPFLDFDKLQKAVVYISDCGFKPKIVTNCFWASNYGKAVHVLESLANQGLQGLRVSADEFHQEFVPLKYVVNVLRAARALGLETSIGSIRSKRSSKNYRDILDRAVGLEGLDFLWFELGHAGRAENLPSDYFGCLQGKELKIGCNVMENSLIVPNGSVYPCCMVPLSEKLSIGNLHNAGDTLHELLTKASNSPLITALSLYGPLKLYERFSGENWAENRKPFATECEVCNWLLSDVNAPAFMAMLEKSRIEIFAAKTIIESEEKYRRYL